MNTSSRRTRHRAEDDGSADGGRSCALITYASAERSRSKEQCPAWRKAAQHRAGGAEYVIQPDSMRGDLGGKAIAVVRWGAGFMWQISPVSKAIARPSYRADAV
jgi:hypothetical protein